MPGSEAEPREKEKGKVGSVKGVPGHADEYYFYINPGYLSLRQ